MIYSSNLAPSWTAANFFFAIVMLPLQSLHAQHATASTAGFSLCSTALTSPIELSFALNPSTLSIRPTRQASDSTNKAVVSRDSSHDSAGATSLHLALQSTPNPLQLRDLALHELRLSGLQLGSLDLGIRVGRFGGDLYNELQTAVSVSHRLASSIALGGSLGWSHATVRDYSSHSFFTIDAGMYMQLSEQFRCAACILNCTRNGNDVTVDQEMHCGIALHTPEALDCEADFVVQPGRQSALLLAVSQDLLNTLRLRSAYNSGSQSVECTVFLTLSRSLQSHCSALYHASLGYSLSGGFTWNW